MFVDSVSFHRVDLTTASLADVAGNMIDIVVRLPSSRETSECRFLSGAPRPRSLDASVSRAGAEIGDRAYCWCRRVRSMVYWWLRAELSGDEGWASLWWPPKCRVIAHYFLGMYCTRLLSVKK